MQLGTFQKDSKTGKFTGSIRTLSSVIDHVEIAPAEKRSSDSPDYAVFGPTGSDFGAAWNKTARDTGKPYISVVLRDPDFNNGQPMYPILVERESGLYAMIWEASDPNRAPSRPVATPAEATARPAAPAPGRTRKA